MARGLRVLLRVVLAGLVGAGCVLFWLSVARNGGHRRGEGTATGARRVQGEAAAKGYEEPSVAAAERAVTSPGEPAAEKSAEVPTEAEAQPVTLKQFTHTIYDDQNRPTAVITGKEARYWDKKKLYKIVAPDIVFRQHDSPSEPEVGAELRKVHLTAQRAVLHEAEKAVHLVDSVWAESEDFVISTTDVTYLGSQHRLKSDAELALRQYRTDSAGRRALSMEVTGKEFSVDLTLRKVVIERDPVAKLFNVSRDFLAGDEEQKKGREALEDVVITAKGQLTYEYLARTVTFTRGVGVGFGEKLLTCERLLLGIGENDKKDRVGITNMTASGAVEFTCGEQKAAGEKLEWQPVTQVCELSGKDSTLHTSECTIRADRIKFYRLNNRFSVDGPGTVEWSGRQQERPSSPPESEPGADRAADLEVLSFEEGRPVEVTWGGSMTYARAENWAVFKDAVRVRQQGDGLSAGMLRIEFDPQGRQVARVTAEGGVELSRASQGVQEKSTCERAVWDAAGGTVKLSSTQGATVVVLSGGQQLVSKEVILHPEQDKLSCPAEGSMTLPAEQKGQDEGDAEVITVEWKKWMEFVRDEETAAVFHGQVKASRGKQKISCDALGASFDADMAPLVIVASDNAVLEVQRATAPQKDGGAHRSRPNSGEHEGRADEGVSLEQLARESSAWRLSGQKIVIEPPADSLRCVGAGTMEVLGEDGVTDSIHWKKAMSVSTPENFADFQGDVEARVSGAVLLSQRLRVDFSPKGELRHIQADEDVEFSTGGQDAWRSQCGSAEAFFVLDSRLQQVVARREVRLTDAERRLEAGLLHLFFEDTGPEGKPALSRAVARDEVRLSYETRGVTGTGDELQWDRDTNMYVLSGEPYAELRTEQRISRGRKLWFDRLTGEGPLPERLKDAGKEASADRE